MMKRGGGGCGSVLIKIGANGLGTFMEMLLISTLGQKILMV